MRKKLSLLLVVVLLAGVIGGCGTAAPDNATPSPVEAKASASASASSSAATEPETKQTAEKTQLNVTAVIHAWTKDLEELPMIQKSLEVANLEVNWNYVRSGWDEKKTVILASGDVPDVFLGWAINDNDIASFTNVFVPLNDLVEQYAPNIQKMFLETPDLKALATYSDGNLYTLPSLIPNRPSSFDTFSINKVWLDELGLEVPTTLDEYHQVLKAFKEKDPNGNGKQDEIDRKSVV